MEATHDADRNHRMRVDVVLRMVDVIFMARADCKLDVLNMCMLKLSAEEREVLRAMAAIHQERYLEARRVVQVLEEQVYNAQNSMELRLLLHMSIRMVRQIREMQSQVGGERLLILAPPVSRRKRGPYNPLTRPMNDALGIKEAKVWAPFTFKDDRVIKAQMELALQGHRLYLASEAVDGIDAAAWDTLGVAREVILPVYYLKPPVGETACFPARVLMLVMKRRWIWGF
eukprot:3322900-Prymnesium_polylepis.1